MWKGGADYEIADSATEYAVKEVPPRSGSGGGARSVFVNDTETSCSVQ